MTPLPRPQWPETCVALSRSLAERRPPLFQACVDALSGSFPSPPGHAFGPYSASRHAPFLTVGQLASASYLVWKRAYVSSADYGEFIRYLWSEILGAHFVTASTMLDRLAVQSPTRFEQLLALFSGLLAELPAHERPARAMLLVSRVGIPLVETSFEATSDAFGDPDPMPVTLHRARSAPNALLFDSGLVEYLSDLRRRGEGF